MAPDTVPNDVNLGWSTIILRQNNVLNEPYHLIQPQICRVNEPLFVLGVPIVTTHRPRATLSEIINTENDSTLILYAVHSHNVWDHSMLMKRAHPKAVEQENGIMFFITIIRTIFVDPMSLLIANMMPAIQEKGRESPKA
jgi:hypothetical protein